MRLHKVAMIASLLLGLWAAVHIGVAAAADGDQYIGCLKGLWAGAGAGRPVRPDVYPGQRWEDCGERFGRHRNGRLQRKIPHRDADRR
jgi:hypothetical protein